MIGKQSQNQTQNDDFNKNWFLQYCDTNSWIDAGSSLFG